MKTTVPAAPLIIPVDDEHARMMAYARSPEGQAKIAQAQAEIDAGEGILVDDAYFENLKARRAQRRGQKSTGHA